MIPVWYLNADGRRAVTEAAEALRQRLDYLRAMRAASARWGL